MQELDDNLARWRGTKFQRRPRTIRKKPQGDEPNESSQTSASSVAPATPKTPEARRLGPIAAIVLLAIVIVAFLASRPFTTNDNGEGPIGHAVPTPGIRITYASGVPQFLQEPVVRDVVRRRNIGPFMYGFVKLESANLTRGPYTDLIVHYPGGATSSPAEICVYRTGSFTRIADLPLAYATDVEDFLGLNRLQIARTYRTYAADQYSGGVHNRQTVFCWTGSAFIPILTHSVDSEGMRVRTETHGPVSRCR